MSEKITIYLEPEALEAIDSIRISHRPVRSRNGEINELIWESLERTKNGEGASAKYAKRAGHSPRLAKDWPI